MTISSSTASLNKLKQSINLNLKNQRIVNSVGSLNLSYYFVSGRYILRQVTNQTNA